MLGRLREEEDEEEEETSSELQARFEELSTERGLIELNIQELEHVLKEEQRVDVEEEASLNAQKEVLDIAIQSFKRQKNESCSRCRRDAELALERQQRLHEVDGNWQDLQAEIGALREGDSRRCLQQLEKRGLSTESEATEAELELRRCKELRAKCEAEKQELRAQHRPEKPVAAVDLQQRREALRALQDEVAKLRSEMAEAASVGRAAVPAESDDSAAASVKVKGAPPSRKPAASPPPPKGLSAARGKASAALPPPPPKGGGGAAPKGPPPPKAATAPGREQQAPTKAKAATSSAPAVPLSNGLVNIAWRPTVGLRPSDLAIASDKLLSPIIEFLDDPVEEALAGKDTVFGDVEAENGATSSTLAITELSAAQLQTWFLERPKDLGSNTGIAGGNAGADSVQRGTKRLLDEKLLMSVSVLVQRCRMKQNSAESTPGDDVVAWVRRALLNCSLTAETLEGLRGVLLAHREAGSPVTEFVKAQGVDSLSCCDPLNEHRLVHMACDVPGAEDRTRILLFVGMWNEGVRKAKADLQVLHEGMLALVAKKEALRKFFQTALRLGNSLNKDSHAPVAARGFRLGSLRTLLQLRTSRGARPGIPQAQFLHCVLSLLEDDEVESLCTDLGTLAAAKDRKSGGVHQHCQELLQGYLAMEKLAAGVPPLKKRRRAGGQQAPRVPLGALNCNNANGSPESSPEKVTMKMVGSSGENSNTTNALEELVDPEDRFHDYTRAFFEQSRPQARWIAGLFQDVFETYWDLAVYFEDPNGVFPPPQRESDQTEDLFNIFHHLCESVAKYSKDLLRLGLREEIAVAESQPTMPLTGDATGAEAAVPGEQPTGTLQAAGPASDPAANRLDATALRRLQSARASSLTRGRGSAVSAGADRVAGSSAKGDDEDSCWQSDVSDWENSPRRTIGSNVVAVPASSVPDEARAQAVRSAVSFSRVGPEARQFVAGPKSQSAAAPQQAPECASESGSRPSPASQPAAAPAVAPAPALGLGGSPAATTTAQPPRRTVQRRLPDTQLLGQTAQPLPTIPGAMSVSEYQSALDAMQYQADAGYPVAGPPSATVLSVAATSSSALPPSPREAFGGGKALGPPPARPPSRDGKRAIYVTHSASAAALRGMPPRGFDGSQSGALGTAPALVGQGPPQRPPLRPPQQVASRRNPLRKSLAIMADRVESMALSKFFNDSELPESDEECGSESTSEIGPYVSSLLSPSRMARPKMSSVASPRGLPPARPPSSDRMQAPLATQLRAEVRRRSLSRGKMRTPMRHMPQVGGLTPVAEPGETPGSAATAAGRGGLSSTRGKGRGIAAELGADGRPDAVRATLQQQQQQQPAPPSYKHPIFRLYG